MFQPLLHFKKISAMLGAFLLCVGASHAAQQEEAQQFFGSPKELHKMAVLKELHQAIQNDNDKAFNESFIRFMNSGCTINWVDPHGKTFLDYAKQGGRVYQHLKANGGAHAHALNHSKKEEVDRQVDAKEERAYPLHAMVRTNNFPGTRCVVYADKNKDLLNQRDRAGKLPLDYASYGTELYKWLKNQGAHHKPVHHKELMLHLQNCLGVSSEPIYSGIVVEQALVGKAGIATSQQGARFRAGEEQGSTNFWLNLSDDERTMFMKYYNERFPNFIRTVTQPQEKELKTIVKVDTAILYYGVAPALAPHALV